MGNAPRAGTQPTTVGEGPRQSFSRAKAMGKITTRDGVKPSAWSMLGEFLYYADLEGV